MVCQWKNRGESTDIPVLQNDCGDGLDGLLRSMIPKKSWTTQYSRSTNLHENLHVLQHLAVKLPFAVRKLIYCCGTHGFIVDEPPLKTSDLDARIPVRLKSQLNRYNHYVSKRPNDSLVENIVDEWNAYLTGATGNLNWGDRQEAAWDVHSAIEFFVMNSYALGLVHQTGYHGWPQYQLVYALLTLKTTTVWQKAKQGPVAPKTRTLLAEFWKDSSVVNEMRQAFNKEAIQELQTFFEEHERNDMET